MLRTPSDLRFYIFCTVNKFFYSQIDVIRCLCVYLCFERWPHVIYNFWPQHVCKTLLKYPRRTCFCIRIRMHALFSLWLISRFRIFCETCYSKKSRFLSFQNFSVYFFLAPPPSMGFSLKKCA